MSGRRQRIKTSRFRPLEKMAKKTKKNYSIGPDHFVQNKQTSFGTYYRMSGYSFHLMRKNNNNPDKTRSYRTEGEKSIARARARAQKNRSIVGEFSYIYIGYIP